MKQEVTKTEFIDRFLQSETYKKNFSYDALDSLYDYFEQLEDDIGESIDFDMVAICCEYAEATYEDFVNNYSNHFNLFEHIEYGKDYIDLKEEVQELCRDNGDFIEVDEDSFVYRCF